MCIFVDEKCFKADEDRQGKKCYLTLKIKFSCHNSISPDGTLQEMKVFECCSRLDFEKTRKVIDFSMNFWWQTRKSLVQEDILKFQEITIWLSKVQSEFRSVTWNCRTKVQVSSNFRQAFPVFRLRKSENLIYLKRTFSSDRKACPTPGKTILLKIHVSRCLESLTTINYSVENEIKCFENTKNFLPNKH